VNGSTGHYTLRVMLTQLGTGVAAFAAIALLSPLFLLFDLGLWTSVLAGLAKVALIALGLSATVTAVRMRSHRFALRALSLQSSSIEAADLRALDALPASTTLTFFLVSALASLLVLVPGVRPETLDDGRTASLVVLAITILSAAAIPHYVLARRATLRLVELSPIETTTALIDDRGPNMEERIRRRILLSVAAPAMLVGAGTVLLAHAHLRAFLEDSRKTTAVVVARAALDSQPGALGAAADEDAIRAARELGFAATITRKAPGDVDDGSAAGVTLLREPDGSLAASVPLDEGAAIVRFSADPPADSALPGILVALFATFVAAALGLVFGREVSKDLERAARRVRALAGQGDLRTDLRPAGQDDGAARFDVVSRLEQAIETLTDRFRVFAAAQERALGARETAQRVRGLLFASVSHDLKSPLNAILGFTDLLASEELTSAQRESLHLIRTRGRELLGLIETILDAARIEAGQLQLAPRPVPLAWLLSEAVRKAADLIGEDVAPPIVEGGEDLVSVIADPTHGTRAIGVIVAHALRTTASDPNAQAVRVQARATPGERVRIDVIYGSREASAEIGALAVAPSMARARGLILGLSLSRRVIELHRGEVVVETLPDGRAVCRVLFPAGPYGMPLARPSDQG
jgi:signal transduction histidine kinase